MVGVKGCSKCVHRALHTPMDTALGFLLDTAGVSEHTKKILVDQGIVSRPIFSSLREQHFQRLMPKLTLGQHALLPKGQLGKAAPTGIGEAASTRLVFW